MADEQGPPPVGAVDEGRHPSGPDPLWNESWYFDFATRGGELGGYVRLGLYPNQRVAWWWAYVVAEGRPLLSVRHHEVALPRGPQLEIRAEGLWAAVFCETPHEHWSVGLEAFAVALDEPADATERGDRVPLGLDLEWEADAPAYPYPGVDRYEQSCSVSGELLIGDDTVALDCHGQRDHSWGVRDWWRFGWTWMAGRLDDGTSFHATRLDLAGVDFAPGYLAAGGRLDPAPGMTVDTALGDSGLPVSARMMLGPLDLDVAPVGHAPVPLIAPDGRAGRLARSLCRFTTGDGRRGTGWTEWNQPPPVVT